VPLLQSNCNGCHSQAALSGGVNLEGHNRVKIFADNGRLLGAVSHAAGFSPMPKGGSKLPDCEINKIKSWINAGSPDN
jgi:mono/diheme cytochrome c family protein